jgi:hypothetical protein
VKGQRASSIARIFMAASSKNGSSHRRIVPLAVPSERLSSRELSALRKKVDRLDVSTMGQAQELLRIQVLSLNDFRGRWLFDNKNPRDIIRKCRQLVDGRTNDFLDFVIRTKMQFFNAGFEIWTPTNKKKTDTFAERSSNYPFAALSRDVWKEWLTCSNVVAFWRDRGQIPADQLIDGMPRVTILNAEDVEYHNDFGVESVKIFLKARKLTAAEREALGPRYANAIEKGLALELSKAEGENWKVLTTAKLGNGFSTPRLRAIFDDLAARDLLKIGDWNGAWARKHLIRHGKKGHAIKDGPLAGMPEYMFRDKYGKALNKSLESAPGFMNLISNFDLLFEYVYLNPDFFDPKIYKGIQDRLTEWAGACMLMLRDGNPNPNLTKMFQAEGLAEREIVGPFLESILNDPTFRTTTVRGMENLQVRWDEWIFFNQAELRQMITFGIQNGVMSPQSVQRAMRIDSDEHLELMTAAIGKRELWTPAFEAKQGMAAGEAGLAPGNSGGDAGAAGGRPTK